jgi:hypothetical protein
MMSFQVGRPAVVLTLVLVLGVALAATAFPCLEAGFLLFDFLKVDEAGLAGELDTTDMAIIMCKVRYLSKRIYRLSLSVAVLTFILC